jgi:lipopolysaccharide transport system ATP-binding protein
MSELILKVKDLSKQYRLGEVGTGTISHDLNRWWAKIRGKEDPYSRVGQTNDRTKKAVSDYVNVLQDVSFEVNKGDVVGIIGKNGAGKSTLLKLISRITSPTSGYIKAKGRIASLLEVGTGMNLEMTARENIFLNGSILGMTKKEITSKFDEIVDFAGCAMFVDTPVKRFSSGMRVRLGFAVAAFLEPEILIVDEVLAVGDAEFQKKALGKMQSVAQGGGRTILFVSHNMAAISQICTRSIVLDKGTIVFDGDNKTGIAKYVELSNLEQESGDLVNRKDRGGSGEIRFTKISLLNENNEVASTFFQGESLTIQLYYDVNNKIKDYSGIHFSINMFDMYGDAIFCHQNLLVGQLFKDVEIKEGAYIEFKIPCINFAKGNYHFNCDIVDRNTFIEKIDYVASINIQEGLLYNYTRPMLDGKVAIEANWGIVKK